MLVIALSLAACAEQRPLGEPCIDDCVARVHAAGILEPTSEAFHGRELRRRNWDFALCASCHGDDFAGGRAGVSCLECHREGPTACVTCHRDGPTSNAHATHRTNAVECAECHVVPSRWDAPGHLGSVDVTFGARAQATPVPADRPGPPLWDGASCRNVYCHGAALHAGGGLATAPRWEATVETGRCDRCHASPPPSHARTDCATCHPASAPHVDGALQLGSGCSDCHGSATSPAPPRDLTGNQFTTALGVGAHQAHLQGASRLAAPIACATCHVVPATVDAMGHIDSPAPAEVVAAVGWERSTQTCSTACHGAARPPWTSSGQVSCGSCHGVPPSDASHTPTMPITACASCHPDTVDAFGNIVFTAVGSKHLDGVVDAP